MSATTVDPGHDSGREKHAAPPLLVSVHQAAGLLGIGRTTLYELIKLGTVTPLHIGRCVRLSLAELERYVEHLMVGTAESALPSVSNRRTTRRQELASRGSTATPT